jgi:signal transduction histidine kinase
VWPRRSSRVRPPREHARLARVDRWRAAAVVLLAAAAALLTVAVGVPAQVDPVADTQRARGDLATALAQQLRPVFTELRRQVGLLASTVGGGGPALPAAQDGTLPRWYWATDDAGIVVATGPSTGGLLGRSRPVPERARVLRGQVVVGRVARDPLLGATVVLLHARTGNGRVLTAAVAATSVGLQTSPQQRGATRIALIGPDRSVASGAGRQPTDGSLAGALTAARGTGDQVVRYRGEGQSPRLAAVAIVGDGWTVVAEGSVPGDSGRRTRTRALYVGAAVALLGTLAALVVGRTAVRRTARRAEAVQHALLTVTGHELRTPLTIIIGSTRTLTSRWERLDDGKRKELAAAIGRQAKQMDRLVERLLHAGRLAAGQTSELSVRATDLSVLATSVLDEVRRLSPLHDFRLEVQPGTAPAAADERGLTQVLEHLLDNAVKYSPDGGEVLVEVQPEGRLQKRVRLSVSDEGVGLPADTTRLFRPFGQSQDVNTRTTEEGGVGVGLSIVKDLVAAMGGSVHAERRPVGSTFVVVLPAAAT